MGAHACSFERTFRSRVLRGERHPRRSELTNGISTSSVEVLSEEKGEFVKLPPLSCGAIQHSVAIAVEESDSAAGQVLLIGGLVSGSTQMSRVSG